APGRAECKGPLAGPARARHSEPFRLPRVLGWGNDVGPGRGASSVRRQRLGKAVGLVMSDGGGSCRSRSGSVGTVGLRAFGCLALMVLIGSSTAPAAKVAVREIPVGLIPL